MPLHDHPKPTLSPSDPRLNAWRAFVQAQARLARRLDEELRAEHDLTLAEYEALLAIAESSDRRIRMHQLAERVVLSKSGVTRLIDRLVADGFVERLACPSDARGAEAVLTEPGLERLRAASATHLRGVETHFLSVAGESNLPVLERILGDVSAGLSGGPGVCACGVEASTAPGEAEAAEAARTPTPTGAPA
jgi:DNA-binding MarR family transcriptional regulator